MLSGYEPRPPGGHAFQHRLRQAKEQTAERGRGCRPRQPMLRSLGVMPANSIVERMAGDDRENTGSADGAPTKPFTGASRSVSPPRHPSVPTSNQQEVSVMASAPPRGPSSRGTMHGGRGSGRGRGRTPFFQLDHQPTSNPYPQHQNRAPIHFSKHSHTPLTPNPRQFNFNRTQRTIMECQDMFGNNRLVTSPVRHILPPDMLLHVRQQTAIQTKLRILQRNLAGDPPT
jgi:hypothetical protein